MEKSREIRQLLKSFGKVESFQGLFFTAEVISAEAEKCSVKVGTTTLSDVRTGAVINGNANNLRITPAVGSMVLVADLSGGSMSNLAVIGFSEVDTIVINNGELGGLVKIQELTDKLNELRTTVNNLVTAYNAHVHITTATVGASPTPGVLSPTASTAQKAAEFNRDDYEDIKIKH